MINSNTEKYKCQKQWIVNTCDKIVKLSESIEYWTFEKEAPRWKVAFRDKNNVPFLYKSGSFVSLKIDLQLILFGLESAQYDVN